jgi:hypothetical protein
MSSALQANGLAGSEKNASNSRALQKSDLEAKFDLISAVGGPVRHSAITRAASASDWGQYIEFGATAENFQVTNKASWQEFFQ